MKMSKLCVSNLLLSVPLLPNQGSHYRLCAPFPAVSGFLDYQALLIQPDVGHQVRLRRTWQDMLFFRSNLSPDTAQQAKGSADMIRPV
jgi:hypothetical protein